MAVVEGMETLIRSFHLLEKMENLRTEDLEAEAEVAIPQAMRIRKTGIRPDVNASSVNSIPSLTSPDREEAIYPTRMFVKHCQCSDHPQ